MPEIPSPERSVSTRRISFARALAGTAREMWRQVRAHSRPGFHPDAVDASALIAHWRNGPFGPVGTLHEWLVGVS